MASGGEASGRRGREDGGSGMVTSNGLKGSMRKYWKRQHIWVAIVGKEEGSYGREVNEDKGCEEQGGTEGY